MPATSCQQPLTQKQYDLYLWALEFAQKHHYSPSVRELSQHFRVYPKAIQCRLEALAAKGWIKRNHYRGRGLTFTGFRFVAVPTGSNCTIT